MIDRRSGLTLDHHQEVNTMPDPVAIDIAKPELDSAARAVVAATVSAVNPDQVILFGSRARGDAQADSDIDLLVIMPEPFTAARSRQGQLRLIRRALHDCRLPVDILLYSRDEVDVWRDSPNHVIGRSLREGVAVYARP